MSHAVLDEISAKKSTHARTVAEAQQAVDVQQAKLDTYWSKRVSEVEAALADVKAGRDSCAAKLEDAKAAAAVAIAAADAYTKRSEAALAPIRELLA